MNNIKTWSAAPFVSYDYNKDSEVERAEVRVVLGYGHVSKIEDSSKGQARKVSFSVSNSKYESSGWIPATEGNLIEMVEQAKDEGTPIYFRIETRRKANIDRATPINELTDLSMAKDSINKAVAALRWAEGDDWTFSTKAVTNPKEDPQTGGSGVHSALNMDVEAIPSVNKSKKSSGSFESPPYATFNDNGDVNPGSIAVSVPLNLYTYITEYERNNPEALPNLDEKQRTGLARVLLDISNKMQLEIYDDELSKPDLSAGSHTRARAIIFELIRGDYPLSMEIIEDSEFRKEWSRNLFNHGVKMWRWSIGIVEKTLN